MGLLRAGRDAGPEAGSGDVQHLNQLSAEVRGRGEGEEGAGGARRGRTSGSEARGPEPGLRCEGSAGLRAAPVAAALGGGGICPQLGPGVTARP